MGSFLPTILRGRRTACVWLLAFVACLCTEGACLAEPPARWLTGVALERQRRQPASLNWSGVPIRKGLMEVARLQQAAIVLDRRIDPGRIIEMSARQVSLDDLLNQIAEKVDGSLSWLGPVAYIGPRPAAQRLRTLAVLRAADAHALPKEARALFLADKAWHWDDLEEPRKLLTDLAAEAKVELRGLELMPHDLWPAADLPPLTWIDRLTLVANEFDLTYEIVAAATVRLAPIVDPIRIERSYLAGKEGQDVIARWKAAAPEAEIELSRGKIVVRGRLEDHERLKTPKPTAAATASASASTRPATKLYTLTVPDQPLAAVLRTLRASSIEINIDEAALEKAGLSIERRVTFSVERATLDELLTAALKPAGLTFRRQGDAYNVIPDKQTE